MLSKKIKFFAVPAFLVLLLFVSILLLANILIQRPSVQALIIKGVSEVTGFDIRTNEIELNLWGGIGIFVRGFEARSRQRYEKISASRVRIILDPAELINRRIKPVSIYLYQPKIEMALQGRLGPQEIDAEPGPQVYPMFLRIPGIQSILVEKGQVSIIDRPFDLEDVYLEIRQESSEPVILGMNANGKIWFRGEEILFDLNGTVRPPIGEGLSPSVDLAVTTGKAPLHLIPLPESFTTKKGDFKTRLKIRGNPDLYTSIDGEIFIEPFHLLFNYDNQKKDFFLPDLTLDFQSVIKGKRISVPSLRLKRHDLNLSVAIRLDLTEMEDPFLDLTVKSDFMGIDTLKSLFPTPLLPLWLEDRLFPILTAGDVRLKLLALKGTVEQIQDLPENPSALTMMFECQNFQVSGDGIQLPFEEVIAEVNLKDGDFQVSDLRANFGDSKIKGAGLDVKDVYSDSPRFEILMDGSFYIPGLLRQKEMNLVPPDVRLDLNKIQGLSGRLECKARFGYDYGWEFPRILDGRFIFRDCLLNQKAFLFPVALEKAEILINEKNNNRLRSVGSWGKSRFKMFGSFGITEKSFDIRRIYISSDADMNQVIPVFYRGYELPIEFNRPAACRITAVKKKDYWSCQGQVDLQGMALHTEALSIDPPGTQKGVVFDLGYRPRERIDLEKILCRFNDSALEMSGSYDLKTSDTLDLNLSSSGFLLEDLGIRYKENGEPFRGTLKGHVKMMLSGQGEVDTTISGNIDGEGLFLDLGMFPSPIKECDLGLILSEKKIAIDLRKMKIGESDIHLRGDLTGWDGLKGAIVVNSDFLNISDILSTEDSSIANDRETGPDSFMEMLDIDLRLEAVKGLYNKLGWGPLKADLGLRQGDLFIKDTKVNMEHGFFTAKGYVKKRKAPGLLFSGHISLTDQPIHELLEIIPIGYKDMKGSLSMEAFLSMKGKEKKDLISSLTGTASLSINKGLIKQSRVFVKVLDFLSLQKIFKQRPPDLKEEGFYFETLKADAIIDKGILRSENFVMRSPVFNAVAYGEADMAQKTVNFILGTQPHGTFDALLNSIPIVGYILTGDDGSFLTYSFEVKGPMSDQRVNFISFENIGYGVGGIIKRLLLSPVKLIKDIHGASKNLINGNEQ